MRAERNGRVEAGDVLAQELSAYCFRRVATHVVGSVDGMDEEVVVLSWLDVQVPGNGMAEYRAVLDDVDVHVRHAGAVLCRIGEVDQRGQRERGGRRVDDMQVVDLRHQFLIPTIMAIFILGRSNG